MSLLWATIQGWSVATTCKTPQGFSETDVGQPLPQGRLKLPLLVLVLVLIEVQGSVQAALPHAGPEGQKVGELFTGSLPCHAASGAHLSALSSLWCEGQVTPLQL